MKAVAHSSQQLNQMLSCGRHFKSKNVLHHQVPWRGRHCGHDVHHMKEAVSTAVITVALLSLSSERLARWRQCEYVSIEGVQIPCRQSTDVPLQQRSVREIVPVDSIRSSIDVQSGNDVYVHPRQLHGDVPSSNTSVELYQPQRRTPSTSGSRRCCRHD